MADMPVLIQIGPIAYTVVQSKEAIDKIRLDSATVGTWGQIHYKEQRITIDPEIGTDQRAVTLLHEVLHGVNHAVRDGVEVDERIIDAVAILLLDTLRRNPQLVEYLLGC